MPELALDDNNVNQAIAPLFPRAQGGTTRYTASDLLLRCAAAGRPRGGGRAVGVRTES